MGFFESHSRFRQFLNFSPNRIALKTQVSEKGGLLWLLLWFLHTRQKSRAYEFNFYTKWQNATNHNHNFQKSKTEWVVRAASSRVRGFYTKT